MKRDRFEKLTRFDKLSQVLSAIDKALSLNLKVKINTVIVDDINKDEIYKDLFRKLGEVNEVN